MISEEIMRASTIRIAIGIMFGILGAAACSTPPPAQTAQTATPATGAAALDRTVLPIAEPNYPQAKPARCPQRQGAGPLRGQGAAGRAERHHLPDRRHWVRSPEHVRRPDSYADARSPGEPGAQYNRFHTTALCSPTRVAILTGRNHHTNNAGAIMEVATAFPGNTGARPQSVTPLAEILRQNGYSTSAFGKYHETAPWEVSVSGPFDRWPTHSGFDKFYGFIGGETNQWAPLVYDGTVKVEPPHDPNYHFTTDMTNQAIRWIRSQQALTPDKPFFTYFAPGATHAPHHVPKDWIAKFKGKFDGGWDKYREETFARQKQLGIVPANTKLASKPPDIKDWDALSADEKRLFARQMEVFAAFAAHTDYEIGRVVQAIEDMGELDNTMILYIVGDNGASAEGGMAGMFNEMTFFNGVRSRCPTCSRTSTAGAGPKPSRTWRRAGRWPAIRPSCGPSRWRPTSAARATRS